MQCKNCNYQLEDGSAFCPKCGTRVEKEAASICPQCGAKAKEGHLFCYICGAKIEAPKEDICKNCGNKIDEGSVFCPKCGSKLGSNESPVMRQTPQNQVNYQTASSPTINQTTYQNINPPINQPANYSQMSQPASYNTQDSSAETVLYNKKMIGYYTGLTQISGGLVITNKKITYSPLPIHILSKEFTINMSDVTLAERASVMGINLCIRVHTVSGKKHLFALGIQHSQDIQSVVDMINNSRGR